MQITVRVRPDLAQLASQFDGDVTDGFNWGELVPVVADAAERIFRTEGGGTVGTVESAICGMESEKLSR